MIECPQCGKKFDSKGEYISLRMHQEYVHNSESKYQQFLRRKQAEKKAKTNRDQK